MWPGLLALIGVAIYSIFKVLENKAKKNDPRKWIGAAPLLLGLILGWSPFSLIRDKFYYESIKFHGDKMIWAHYGAFIVPILGLVGIGVWFLLDKFLPEEYVEVE
jgi:hypothetical protein